MTALWTAATAAQATSGQASRDFTATGVSIDSRSLRPGDLFVALSDQRDGHDFVAQALAKGAAAALVTHRPADCPADAPLLIVPAVLPALEALGRAARARSQARVIAVTGSVGKTSTKEMLRAILSRQGATHAAEASYNNHWGVPLTLARMPADSRFAVIEIGMSNPGEIAPLAQMARPDVALITTIAAAHLEAFDDLDGIAREKAAIFSGLEPGGVAVLPCDLAQSPILAQAAAARLAALAAQAGAKPGRLIGFGAAVDADFRLLDLQLGADTTVIRAQADGQALLFKLATPGRHFALNGLGALAAAAAAGADLAIAALDLALWAPPSGRGMRERIVLDIVEDSLAFDLVDDAFNANPASLGAALDMLAQLQPRDGLGRLDAGRRVAILGDMLELGPDELALHAALADHPAMAAVDIVHCVGPRMRALHSALPRKRRGEWLETAPEMAARAHQLADAGDVVLVKGSKGSKVSLVVDALRKLGQAVAQTNRGTE